MKQTRAALTMLLSAYRSIFANSYLKGLACGVIAASALAAGSASADDLSKALATEADAVTAENAVTAVSDSDTLSGPGYAYSLTVGSGYELTIDSGDVDVADGGAAVNGTLTLASGASLTVALNNNYTLNDYYSQLLYNDMFQLSSSAVSLGSGTINVAEGAEFTLGAGIYDLNGLDVSNSGEIVVDKNATVFLSDVDALKALGSVNIYEDDDEELGGKIVLTASRSTVDQSLFGETALHSDTNDAGVDGHGDLIVKELVVTSSTLDTHGVELESTGDAYLTADSSNNTFTFEGDGVLGVQNGSLYLIDEDGKTIDGGTIKITGNRFWIGDYAFSDQTYTVDADIVLTDGEEDDDVDYDSRFAVDFGNWILKDVTITDGKFDVGDDEDAGYGTADVTMDTLTLEPGDSDSVRVKIAANATVTAKAVKASGGSIEVTGTLEVEGDGSGSTVDLALSDGASLTLGATGSLILNDAADTIGLNFSGSSFDTGDGYNKITSNGGTIEADLSNVVSGSEGLTYDEANKLFEVLASGSGLVKIDGVDVKINATYSDEYDADVVLASAVSGCTFYTDDTLETIVTEVSGPITGGWKAVVLAEGTTSASVEDNGTLIIAGSTSNGNLVETAEGTAGGLSLGDGSTVTLTGTGTIGSISGGSATLAVSSNAQVTVEAAEGDTSVEVGTLSVDSATLQVNGTVTTSDLSATSAQISAENLTLNSKGDSEGSVVGAGSSVTVADTAVINQNLTVTGNSSLTAGNVKVGENVSLQVGQEGVDAGTGTLAADTLTLSGGTLILDPDFGQATAMAAVKSFSEVEGSDTDDLQAIDGDVIVGKNSALGVGMTFEELQSFVSAYQVNGSLVEGSDYGSITVINTSGVQIASGKQLVLGTDNLTTLQGVLTTYSTDNSIYFGEGASLIFTAASLVGDASSSTLSFEDGSGTLYAAGGQIVIPAGITDEQLANLITAANGGSVTVDTVGDDVDGLLFTTYNGLFTDVLLNGESLSALDMTLSENSRSILSGLSNPMYNFVIESFNNDAFATAQGAGAAFLQDAVGYTNGSSVETAARLAVFGGAVQAAYLVEQEAANAIRSRAGFTAASNLTVAENNGFGLWLLPVYRYLDASGFNAGGLDAGAEINLYGVSLGADYAFADTARVGLMFSVGTGDADGKDAGSKVNNDFDYYSAGLYAVINPVENFDILARLTYSEVDNDLDASSGMSDYGTLKASTDSSALSFGVEAKYTFKTGLVDIAPHLGLTYTKLKLDDYEVGSAQGSILKSDNDNLDVFSIPLGVKFSSSLAAGDWSISPAADLHVAFNAGDDELDSDVTFRGLDRKVALSAEVLDEFTYGIDLGISAQYQSLRLGLQVGYEGSDNTDAFGVVGNVSYIF